MGRDPRQGNWLAEGGIKRMASMFHVVYLYRHSRAKPKTRKARARHGGHVEQDTYVPVRRPSCSAQ